MTVLVIAILAAWQAQDPAAVQHAEAAEAGQPDEQTAQGAGTSEEALSPTRGESGLTGSLAPGDSFRDCPDCPEMIIVPAGRFLMGSPPAERGHVATEAPRHEVTIKAPFAIGKYEITQGQWQACLDEGGCLGFEGYPHGGSDRLPVAGLSWLNIPSYLVWLNGKSEQAYRLPTEAEWEYVARAGSSTAYAFGDDLAPVKANVDNRVGGPAVVGRYPPNRWGVHDMHGNAAEWVEDCWIESYAAPTDGSAWSPDCLWRVWRGGHWASESDRVRSAARDYDRDGNAGYRVGFRVVQAIQP